MQVLTAPVRFGHSDCERIVDAALAQPVLAVTSLAYVAAGIAVLCWAMPYRCSLTLMGKGASGFSHELDAGRQAEFVVDVSE